MSALTLPDGRAVGYRAVGPEPGDPVFYFHGLPGSRLEVDLLAHAARTAGVRLVALDRPGIGRSDPRPGRELLDWPETVAAVATELDHERFGVVGFSAGAPYALACARELDPTGVAVLSGAAPPAVDPPGPGKRLLARAPWLARPPWALLGWLADRAPGVADSLFDAALVDADREALSGDRGELMDAYAEAARRGGAGLARETALLARPWGFDLSAVDRQVHLFHGEADASVDPETARRVADRLPDARTHWAPGGHFAAWRSRAAEALAAAGR